MFILDIFKLGLVSFKKMNAFNRWRIQKIGEFNFILENSTFLRLRFTREYLERLAALMFYLPMLTSE
jgi:hypothetical protein